MPISVVPSTCNYGGESGHGATEADIAGFMIVTVTGMSIDHAHCAGERQFRGMAGPQRGAGLLHIGDIENSNTLFDRFEHLDLVKRLGIYGGGILVEDHEVGELAYLD